MAVQGSVPRTKSTEVRLKLLFQSLVHPEKIPAKTPATSPRTRDNGPCAICQPLPDLGVTARLINMVYPVIAIASSKLAAATTVAGTTEL